MASVKRIVLDVLKPHAPKAIEFATAIAEQGEDCRVKVTVTEVDEKTESVVVIIDGENIDYDAVVETISTMGGSVHSIDEVEVVEGVRARDAR